MVYEPLQELDPHKSVSLRVLKELADVVVRVLSVILEKP